MQDSTQLKHADVKSADTVELWVAGMRWVGGFGGERPQGRGMEEDEELGWPEVGFGLGVEVGRTVGRRKVNYYKRNAFPSLC